MSNFLENEQYYTAFKELGYEDYCISAFNQIQEKYKKLTSCNLRG